MLNSFHIEITSGSNNRSRTIIACKRSSWVEIKGADLSGKVTMWREYFEVSWISRELTCCMQCKERFHKQNLLSWQHVRTNQSRIIGSPLVIIKVAYTHYYPFRLPLSDTCCEQPYLIRFIASLKAYYMLLVSYVKKFPRQNQLSSLSDISHESILIIWFSMYWFLRTASDP